MKNGYKEVYDMKKTETHKVLRRVAVSFFMLVAAVLIPWQPASAECTKPFKAGTYYFKFDEDNWCVLYSSKKKAGYKETPVQDPHFLTTGKEIVFIDGRKIKTYNIASKKTRKLKTMPDDYEYEIVGYKGKYLWINISAYDGNPTKLYRYNIKTGKLKVARKHLFLYHLKGKYYLGIYGKRKVVSYIHYYYDAYNLDDGDGYFENAYQKMAIYKINKKGKIKRIKKLGNVYYFGSKTIDRYDYPWRGVKTIYYVTKGGRKLNLANVCQVYF